MEVQRRRGTTGPDPERIPERLRGPLGGFPVGIPREEPLRASKGQLPSQRLWEGFPPLVLHLRSSSGCTIECKVHTDRVWPTSIVLGISFCLQIPTSAVLALRQARAAKGPHRRKPQTAPAARFWRVLLWAESALPQGGSFPAYSWSLFAYSWSFLLTVRWGAY